MKTIIIMLLLSFVGFAQQKTEIEVYKYTNGIKNITPSQVIIKDKTETKIYQTTNGIRNLNPSKIIDKQGNIYKTTNGIKDLNPSNKIEIKKIN